MQDWDSTWNRIADGLAQLPIAGMERESLAAEIFGTLRCILAKSTRRQLGSRESEWEDALQTLFMRMLENPGNAPVDGTGFRKWINAFRRNICLEMLRRKRPSESLPEIDPPVAGSGVVTRIHQASEQSRLRRHIAQLPAPLRDVTQLKHIEGLATDEIARRLDQATRAIRKRLDRAVSRLAEQMGARRPA